MYYPSSMYLGGSLLEAVERDFLNVVQYLTPQTDLNTSNLTGDTSLHRAADLGRLEMVKILLQAGANMHLVNQSGQRPIDCALIRGHQEVVHLLQAAEMCAAIVNMNMHFFSTLVAAGANVNKTDHWGLAPLHYAAMHGRTYLIPLLLQARGNLEVPNSSSSSRPLHIAIEYEQTEMVRALLSAGAEIQAITSAGETPLHRAVLKNSRKEIVQLLLDAGADTGNLDYAGNTPLMSATSAHSSEIIPLLEKKRIVTASMIRAILSDRRSRLSQVPKDILNEITGTLILDALAESIPTLPLDHLQHTVDIYGHVEPAVETPAERKEKYFAVTGENLHKQAFNLRQRARQDRLLSHAIDKRNPSAVERLLFAEVVGTESLPYHCGLACRGNTNVEIVRLFMQSGTVARAINADLLLDCHTGNHHEILGLLLNAGAKFCLSFADPRYANSLSEVLRKRQQGEALTQADMLLLNSRALEVRGEYGDTPLMYAAHYSLLETAQWLLAEGADVNARNNKGETALHFAASIPCTSPDMVALLLAAGADRNARDETGQTPLDYFSKRSESNAVGDLLKTPQLDLAQTILALPNMQSSVKPNARQADEFDGSTKRRITEQ